MSDEVALSPIAQHSSLITHRPSHPSPITHHSKKGSRAPRPGAREHSKEEKGKALINHPKQL